MPIYKMKGKKDGSQKYRVRVNYQDNMGVPRQTERVVYGLEEAKLAEIKLSNDVKNSNTTKKITLKQLFDEYTNAKKYEIRETSLESIKKRLEYHLMPDFKDVKLDKLTIPTLQKWKLKMEAKRLTLNTKQGVFGEFRALLNYAVKMEYIPANPLTKVGNFKNPLEIKKEMDFYTADEFKKFINAAKAYAENSPNQNAWGYYVFFNIAFYTGLRKGEIHALRWIDINNGYLEVKRSIAQKLKGEDRITPPKNKSSFRTLQLPTPLINILNEHYSKCKSFNKFSDEWLICGGTKALRDTSIQKANIRFANTAGIKIIRIHDFRHSHASLLANEGINIQEIARRLGHSKIEITWNTYSHLYPREEEKAIKILNEI